VKDGRTISTALLDVADDLSVDNGKPAVLFLLHLSERCCYFFKVGVLREATVQCSLPVIAFDCSISPEVAPLLAASAHLVRIFE
jgi:hypothetical protein